MCTYSINEVIFHKLVPASQLKVKGLVGATSHLRSSAGKMLSTAPARLLYFFFGESGINVQYITNIYFQLLFVYYSLIFVPGIS